MSQVTMLDARTTVRNLSQTDVTRIYKRVVGSKPPRGTKLEALKDALLDALKEQATGEGDAAVLNETAEGWLAGGDGKKPEPAPAPKPEKPVMVKKAPKPSKEPKPRDPRLPAIGEVIRKTWRDRQLEVKCLAGGFEFEGKTYKSLSKIASELQGCPSNGFLFFHLLPDQVKKDAERAAKAAAKQVEAETKPEAPKAAKKPKAKKQAKSGKKSKAK